MFVNLDCTLNEYIKEKKRSCSSVLAPFLGLHFGAALKALYKVFLWILKKCVIFHRKKKLEVSIVLIVTSEKKKNSPEEKRIFAEVGQGNDAISDQQETSAAARSEPDGG